MQFLDDDKRYMPRPIGRRTFLIGVGAAAVVLTWAYFRKDAPVHAEAASAGLPKTVKIVEFTDAGERKETVTSLFPESLRAKTNGGNGFHRLRLRLRATPALNARTPMKTRTTARKVYFAVFAAIPLCSTRVRSSNPGRVGPASGRLLRRKMFWRPRTPVLGCFARRFPAVCVTHISVMYSMMGRVPRGCAIA